MAIIDSLEENISSLKAFWNRRSFHDLAVLFVDKCGGRAIVVFEEYVLVLTGVKKYKQSIEDFPTSWLSSEIEQKSKTAKLEVTLELGEFQCEFANLRLIRRSDFAVLVPAIDRVR